MTHFQDEYVIWESKITVVFQKIENTDMRNTVPDWKLGCMPTYDELQNHGAIESLGCSKLRVDGEVVGT